MKLFTCVIFVFGILLIAIKCDCAINQNENDSSLSFNGFSGFLTRFMNHQEKLAQIERKIEIELAEKELYNFASSLEPQLFSNLGFATNDESIKIYAHNFVTMNELNRKELATGEYGNTRESYMSRDEFVRTRLGYRRDLKQKQQQNDNKTHEIEFEIVWKQLLKEQNKNEQQLIDEAPKHVDWRFDSKTGANVVSPIKDQGQCGSCWSFSTTGAIEGQYGLVKRMNLSLSEEELVDCDITDEGCNGGLPQNAYEQIILLGGLETEQDYPYSGHRTKGGCQLKPNAKKYTIKAYTNLPNDENKIKAWVAYRGPVSIGINAFAMQFYRKGVSHPWKILCNPLELDHAVLIVGYGEEKSRKGKLIPYWIVKNSWGTSWGEKGYYRIYRGANVCGLASDVSAPLLTFS